MTAETKLELGLKNSVADIRQFTGNVRQGDQPAGNFDVSGRFDLTNQVGQLALKLTDLNQNALRPFVEPALGDKTLASVSIHASSTARYDAKGESSLKADLQVTNLVVNDPSGKLPKTLLAAGLQLDASLLKQRLDLRQAQITLAPTDRARNQMQPRRQSRYGQIKRHHGQFETHRRVAGRDAVLRLVHGQKPAGATPAGKAPAPAPAPSPPQPEAEPPAVNLPLQNFVFDANVGVFTCANSPSPISLPPPRWTGAR